MRIADEQIISALFSFGSNRDAAAALGLSEKAFYERLKKPEFQSKLSAAKADILQAATNRAESRLTAALDTMDKIMQDEENPASVRLNASEALIRQTLRLIELVDVTKRLDEIEAAIREAENENRIPY